MALVDRAKYLTNAKLLQVTFVSSEGSVMPLISGTSSKSRASPVVEIVDVSEEQATDYSRKIMPDVAEYVVSLTGGRLTQLLLANHVYVNKADKKDAKESIKRELLNACVKPGLSQIANHKNHKLAINTIKTVVSKGSVYPLELKRILKKERYDGAEVMEAIALLVSANFLRYQRDHSVTCYGKLVEWYVQENWLKEK